MVVIDVVLPASPHCMWGYSDLILSGLLDLMVVVKFTTFHLGLFGFMLTGLLELIVVVKFTILHLGLFGFIVSGLLGTVAVGCATL